MLCPQVLSFSFHDEMGPGDLPDAVSRDDVDLLNLGDLAISLPYVPARVLKCNDLNDRCSANATGT